MGAIKPKYGDCSKCDRKNVLLYRRKPEECQICYNKGKQEEYRARAKKRAIENVLKIVKKAEGRDPRLKKEAKKSVQVKHRINPVSKINHITTSKGERMTRGDFDGRIRKAKGKKLQQMIDDHGYIFCEDCKKNTCKPIDCSHDKSVKKCIEDGVAELSYDVDNITMRGRPCHNLHDKTY